MSGGHVSSRSHRNVSASISRYDFVTMSRPIERTPCRTESPISTSALEDVWRSRIEPLAPKRLCVDQQVRLRDDVQADRADALPHRVGELDIGFRRCLAVTYRAARTETSLRRSAGTTS